MHLSVICPVLHASDELFVLLHSLRSFVPKDYSYEVIIVTTDTTCSSLPSKYQEVRVVSEGKPRGVYAAMNVGIAESKGDYLYFSGQDDHVLSGFTKMLDACIKSNWDYCVGTVIWGDKKIFHPTRVKWKLWFGNWCHQAVLYRRSLFENQMFKEKYSIQADHDLNLFLRYNPQYRYETSKSIVAWYSGAGLSSRNKDTVFWADVPKLASIYCNTFERIIVLSIHYMISCYSKVRKKWKNM